MQRHDEYYTTTTQYYAKDPLPDDEYLVMPQIASQVPHVSANDRTPNYGVRSDPMYGSDKYEDHHQKNFHVTTTPVPHVSASDRTPHYGLRSDSMYGSDKYEDHRQKNFPMTSRHHDKGYHGVPEVNKKVHFVEHVEIDKNGKHEVHDEEIRVDNEADGFIQKKHQTFDKWEMFKRY